MPIGILFKIIHVFYVAFASFTSRLINRFITMAIKKLHQAFNLVKDDQAEQQLSTTTFNNK